MAGIDFSRLRRQNIFDAPIDITQGGIMGNVDMSGTEQDFGGYEDQTYQEPPQQSYQPGGINLPNMEEPFGGDYRVENDPRSYVNPTIAQPVAGPGSSGDEAMNRTIDAINRIYRPEYTSRDRLNRLLDEAPERESPSILSGIAAFGMGMNAKDPLDALKVHEQVMFAPHHRNMADWTAKTQPFSNAAQYENTANINERTLAGNVVTAQTAADRLAENARQADQKNEVARMTAIARQAVANNWKIEEAGGRMMAYPPRAGMGDPIDLGPSGMLTEREKIDLLNSGRLAVAQQQGANQMAVQGSRNAGQLAVQTLRNQRVTGNGGTRGLLPSQQKDAYYNKAQEWIRRNPQDADYISLEPTQRDFTIEEPGTSIFGNPKGMPPERYDAFIDYIYGSGAMAAPAAPSGMPTPPNAPAPQIGAPPAPPQVPGQPQGQLTVPSRDDPRFQTPPGYDPHGRPPASQGQSFPYAMENAPAQPMVTQQARNPTIPPPELQAIVQLDQQIAQLKAQLAAPPAPTPPPGISSVAGTDNSIVGQRFRQNAGLPPTPTSFPLSLPQGTPQGNMADRAGMMEAGRMQQGVVQAQAQQQQIQAKIAELEQQRQAALASLQAAVQAPVQQQQPPQTGFATNKQTGQKVPVISYDGGATWEFK